MSKTPSKFKFVTSTVLDPNSSTVYTAELNEDGEGYTVTWEWNNEEFISLDPSTQYELSRVKDYLAQGDWILTEDLSEDEDLIYEVWLQTENRWGELTKEVYEYLKANFDVQLRTLKVIEQI